MTETDIERDKKISLVGKLLSLANSDNEHEAKLALEQASALMEQYNISEAEAKVSSSEAIVWAIKEQRVYNVPFHAVQMYFDISEFCDGMGVSNYILRDEVTGKWIGKKRAVRDFTFFGTDDDFQNFVAVIGFANLFIKKMVKADKIEHPNEDRVYRYAYECGLHTGIEGAVNGLLFERRARYRNLSKSTGMVLSGKTLAVKDKFPKGLRSHGSSSPADATALSRGIIHGETFSPEGLVSGNGTKLLK